VTLSNNAINAYNWLVHQVWFATSYLEHNLACTRGVFPKPTVANLLATWLAMGNCIATNKVVNLVSNYDFGKHTPG